jgi:hypothetical protein
MSGGSSPASSSMYGDSMLGSSEIHRPFPLNTDWMRSSSPAASLSHRSSSSYLQNLELRLQNLEKENGILHAQNNSIKYVTAFSQIFPPSDSRGIQRSLPRARQCRTLSSCFDIQPLRFAHTRHGSGSITRTFATASPRRLSPCAILDARRFQGRYKWCIKSHGP